MNTPPGIAQDYRGSEANPLNRKRGSLPMGLMSFLPLQTEKIMGKRFSKFGQVLVGLGVLLLQAQICYAEAGSETDLQFFLQGVGDFMIRTMGPGVLVIGVAISGISMALGDEQGMRRGALAAGGGALIMLSRAILALIQNVTHF